METQKILNLLNDSSNEESKFATKNDFATTKTILLNLTQKVLRQVFVVILMHLF